MTTFQALMALSETQTKQSQSAVQIALAQRQQKEESRRKQLAELERKELDLAKQRRLKIFEEERKESERQQKLEQERVAREALLHKREEEARNALLYGPKKAKALSSNSHSDSPSPKWPSSSSQNRTREEVRKRRLPGDEDDDSAPEFLTREEKRERKLQMERRKLYTTAKRSTNTGSYSKAGRRLPGGAVDVTTTSQMADSSMSSKSVKERIAAMPNTLTKLNTVKRDTRTIDEIVQDMAKLREVKVLDGDEARGFDDWFGTTKKKEAVKKASAQPGASTATSGTNTPASQGGSSTPQLLASKKLAPPPKPSLLKTAVAKVASTSAVSRSAPTSRPGSADKISSTTKSAHGKMARASSANAGSSSRPTLPAARKRPRSPSLSDESDYSTSPPPSKRHGSSGLGDTIWKMFGRDRNSYVGKDVFSDDEDMEADATALEREESMSARIAKKEDTLALQEERRREDEKRRRRVERDRVA